MYQPPTTASAHPNQPRARPGSPVDSLRVLLHLWRWRWVFVGVGLGTATAGFFYAKNYVPVEFTSKTVLERPTTVPGDIARDLATTAQSVTIEPTLQRVREDLKLQTNLETLARRIRVELPAGANVLAIHTTGASPIDAQTLGNTVLRLVLDRRLESERAATKANLETLRSALKDARSRLATARSAYDKLRQRVGVSDVTAEKKAAIAELATLRGEQLRARAEAASEMARAGVLRSASKDLPKEIVSSEAELRPDLRKLLELESELAAATASLSPSHPRTRALAAEVDAIRRRANDPKNTRRAERTFTRNPQIEVLRHTMTSAKAQGEAARRRQASLSEELATMEKRITKLTAVEGEANELLAVLVAAETHFAKLQTETQLAEDAVRQPNVRLRVLSPPTFPTVAQSKKRKLVAIATPVAATFLVLLACAIHALWRFRVRSASELAFWGAGPVVTSSAWPRDPKALEDLVIELQVPLASARGRTLIVPASAGEASLATMLASSLVQREYADDARPMEILVQRSEKEGVERLLLLASHAEDEAEVEDPRETTLVSALKHYLIEASPDFERTLTEPKPEPPKPAPIEPPAETALRVRQAAQLADRVLVVVSSGEHSFFEVAQVRGSLGYPQNVGFVMVNVERPLRILPGRVGDVPAFWQGSLRISAAA